VDSISNERERAIAVTLSGLRQLAERCPRRPVLYRARPTNLSSFEIAWRQAPTPIVGYGIALKRTGGAVTDDVCVRIYVRQKLSRRRLRSLALIPPRAEFGTTMPPVAIDVIAMPDTPQLQGSCTAGAGISAAGANGTLGAVVVDALGVRFGLTCAHVVAPWSRPNPLGTPVTLALPGGQQSEAFGTVDAWTLFSALDENTADAALIRLDPDMTVDNALGTGALLDDTPIAALDLLHGKAIRIRTRRGEVSGLVDSVKNVLTFGFAGRDFTFSNILAYQANVMAGDSGSSVVFGTDRLLGLHFAGNGVIGPGYCVTGRKILQAFPNRQLRLP
jgi:hypothetical protein